MDRRSFFKNALATVGAVAGGAWISGWFARAPQAATLPIRPPGARPEREFLSRCIRCLRCADACPNNAIVPVEGSFGQLGESTPTVRPRRQACMLCNKVAGTHLKCTEACPTGALRPIRKDADEIQQRVAMGVAELDRDLCYSYNSWSCGACYRACPFPGRAMSLGLWERPEVHAEACVGCGLCERSCLRYPQAIRVRARGA